MFGIKAREHADSENGYAGQKLEWQTTSPLMYWNLGGSLGKRSCRPFSTFGLWKFFYWAAIDGFPELTSICSDAVPQHLVGFKLKCP
eukprot:s825_g28.t1